MYSVLFKGAGVPKITITDELTQLPIVNTHRPSLTIESQYLQPLYKYLQIT